MNETMMTIRGNVVDAPSLRVTKSGHTVANFRVGSTQRRWDRDKNMWIDGDQLFVSVSAWRALGENAVQSLAKGQPVIVYGRYYQRDYTKEDALKIAYELDAIAIGHDLSRGTSTFEKVVRTSAPQLETDELGPLDASRDYIDGVDVEPGVPSDVDPVTGEVRQLAKA